MDLAEIQREFHKNADVKRFSNRMHNPFLCWKERQIADWVARSVPQGGCRLLEVGCGEGSNLLYLQHLRPDLQLIGLDFSIEKVRLMAEHCPRSKAVCSDAASLPFGEGQFDGVLYRDLLHHVSWSRDKVLTEGLRVLKRDGVVIVFESNGGTLLNRVFRWLHPAERGMRDSTFSRLLALGSRLGKPSIQYVEASFLLRALGFVFGWPEGRGRWLIRPFYVFAGIWERLVERVVPTRRWSYMMMTLRPS